MTPDKNKIKVVFMVGLGLFFITGGWEKAKFIGVNPLAQAYDLSAEGGPPPWAPAHGYRAKYRYFYYPSAYIYFDAGRNLYFYSQSDEWRFAVTLPVGTIIDAEEYVILEMDTDKPYQFHSEVVKRYPPGHQKGKTQSKGKEKAKKK